MLLLQRTEPSIPGAKGAMAASGTVGVEEEKEFSPTFPLPLSSFLPPLSFPPLSSPFPLPSLPLLSPLLPLLFSYLFPLNLTNNIVSTLSSVSPTVVYVYR